MNDIAKIADGLEKSELDVLMLAAWLNVTPEQVPDEYKHRHFNDVTKAGWDRVGKAALEYYRQHLMEQS